MGEKGCCCCVGCIVVVIFSSLWLLAGCSRGRVSKVPSGRGSKRARLAAGLVTGFKKGIQRPCPSTEAVKVT